MLKAKKKIKSTTGKVFIDMIYITRFTERNRCRPSYGAGDTNADLAAMEIL